MKIRNTIKTIRTACGKTITYMQTEGETSKMHSTEGPAIIYPEGDNIAPEYYLYGIKYSKADWKEKLTQYKSTSLPDSVYDPEY